MSEKRLYPSAPEYQFPENHILFAGYFSQLPADTKISAQFIQIIFRKLLFYLILIDDFPVVILATDRFADNQ
jgi:hypothetical protein